MKKIIPAATAATALLVGAVTTAAQTSGDFNAAFGEQATEITKQDMAADANSLFAKVDVDGSGDLDVDEFASHTVILAELARLNRAVTVEGHKDVQIDVPDSVAERMSNTERGSIDAVARRTFHSFSAGDVMTLEGFTNYRMSTMAKADTNRDGTLRNRELQYFASVVAKPVQPRG